MSTTGVRRGALAALRAFVGEGPRGERCELCGAAIAPEHEHLVQPESRALRCACGACAVLFDAPGARWRRAPRRATVLPDFRLSDARWTALGVPIGLAFFYTSRAAERAVALFPGPGGVTEAPVPADAWAALRADNPALGALEPDVEALLVYRVGAAREYLRAPIDACFALAGVVRAHWRAVGGGPDVGPAVERAMARLRAGEALLHA